MPSRLSARCRAAPYKSRNRNAETEEHICSSVSAFLFLSLHGLEFHVVIVIFCFIQSVGDSVAGGE